MPLSQSLFHPEWAFHHRPVANSAHEGGRVRVSRVLSSGEWSPATGQIEGEEKLEIYLGYARVQTKARAIRRDNVQDSEDYQNVDVTFGFDQNEIAWPEGFQWLANDRVEVVACPDDPQMVGVNLYVHGWLGSTNGWQRTLICRIDSRQP